MAKIVVTTKPIQTGRRFLLANSNGSTLQIAAAGINAQGTKVPPPTHMAAICPKAVNVLIPLPIAWANRPAIEPANEMPEKPEPSKPVITPTAVSVTAPISFVNGTVEARATPRSLTIPWDSFGRKSPIIVLKPESPK